MGKKIIRNYLVFSFLYRLAFSMCFATYILFLRENNLTSIEIGLVNFACMVACFFFEIPTGAFADFFGRKASVILGVFIDCLAFLIYFSGHGIWVFILAETMSALGGSFISGALDAWVKDSLDRVGAGNDMGSVYSREGMISQASIIIGGAVGGLIGAYSLRLPWLIGSVGLLFCGIITFFLIDETYFERKRTNMATAFREVQAIARAGIKYGYENKQVWTLIIVFSLYIFGTQAINMLWSVQAEREVGRESISVVWFVSASFFLVGAFLSGFLIKRKVSERTILLQAVLTVAGFIFMATIFRSGWVGISFFWLQQIGRGLFLPTQKAYLQDHIPGDKRATVASFSSMVSKVGAAIGWLGAGILGEYLAIAQIWQMSALIFLLSIPFILKLRNGGKKI